MDVSALVSGAAAPMKSVVERVTSDDWNAATPCAEWRVQDVVSHLLTWGPSLVGAAAKIEVPPAPAQPDSEEWQTGLLDYIDDLIAAWSDPAAWEGVTSMGSPMKLPAPLIGGMVLGELVVHGWDLARATGQRPRWDDGVLDVVLREVAQTAEQGRDMGVYGPQVPVADTAPLLDRILGLTGRDPHWQR